MKRTIFRFAQSLAVIVFLSVNLTQAQAAELPMVQGVTLDGDQLTWDALEGATGYNIRLGGQYLTTIRGERIFTVTEVGTYRVVAFDDNGNFSPAIFTAENSAFFAEGVDNRPTVISLANDVGYFSVRCFDVAAGDSCVASCPDYVGASDGGGFFVDSATGGACNSSGTEFVNSRISRDEYACTVTSFTARVEAQVACNVTPNN